MNTPNENQGAVQTAAHNLFPEPQTIPSGWDTREFISSSQSASVEAGNDTSEREAN